MAGHERVNCPHGQRIRSCRCVGPHPVKIEPCPRPGDHRLLPVMAGWSEDGTRKLEIAPEEKLPQTDPTESYAALDEGVAAALVGLVEVWTDKDGIPHIHPGDAACTERCLGWYAGKAEEKPPGVWVAYHGDRSVVVPFGDELEAYRYASPLSMTVKFVPYGEELS